MAATPTAKPEEPPVFEPAGTGKPELVFWQNGNYALRDSAGRSSSIQISGIGQPVEIGGAWRVTFPPNLRVEEATVGP